MSEIGTAEVNLIPVVESEKKVLYSPAKPIGWVTTLALEVTTLALQVTRKAVFLSVAVLRCVQQSDKKEG